jgi:hypothetical protein
LQLVLPDLAAVDIGRRARCTYFVSDFLTKLDLRQLER